MPRIPDRRSTQYLSPDGGVRIRFTPAAVGAKAQVLLTGSATVDVLVAPPGAEHLRVRWIPKCGACAQVGGGFYYRLRWLDGAGRVLASASNDPLLAPPPAAGGPLRRTLRRVTRALVALATAHLELDAGPDAQVPGAAGNLDALLAVEPHRAPRVTFARTSPLEGDRTGRIEASEA